MVRLTRRLLNALSRPVEHGEPFRSSDDAAGAPLDAAGAIANADAETIDWPHVVAYRDVASGVAHAAGPFACPVAAFRFAEDLRHSVGDADRFEIAVFPLHAPDA